MPSLRPLTILRTPLSRPCARLLTTSAPRSQKHTGANPQANQPDSLNASVRKDTPNTDAQSNASTVEDRSGDEHPAKQPDTQLEPERKTGIGGKGKVEGGKEGLGERRDR